MKDKNLVSLQAAGKKQLPPGHSPRWTKSTKRLVSSVLLVLMLLLIYRIRTVLVPLIMSLVVAYILLPIVDFLQRRTPLSRNMAIAVVYLLILAGLVAIPVGTIPQLINQGQNLITNTPRYLQELEAFIDQPLIIAGYEVPIDQLPIDEAYSSLRDNLLQIVQTVGRSSFNIFGNVASATLSTVVAIIIVLVLSFYIVKDYSELWSSVVEILPDAYQKDMYRLGREISLTWNAFLRGQLILGFIIGLITFVVALIIGLPNALLLALIAGLLEFVPNIGPALAAIPALVLALFQSQSSWLGSEVGAFWYAAIVLIIYIVIQQVENIVLVPRIIGRSLNLHPFVVFIAVLAGANVAGILGILLAAPLLASARLLFLYIYRKLLDQPPFDYLEPAGMTPIFPAFFDEEE